MAELENINPHVYRKCEERRLTKDDENDDVADPFDEREIFGKLKMVLWWPIFIHFLFAKDLIRNINDPEHPLTLEELHVLEQSLITVDNEKNTVKVLFTPTIPHCSMATLIGLSIRVKLLRALPPRFKVSVEINPGTHASENAVNKQLADKERVAAALENSHLIEVINQCIAVPIKWRWRFKQGVVLEAVTVLLRTINYIFIYGYLGFFFRILVQYYNNSSRGWPIRVYRFFALIVLLLGRGAVGSYL